jgi:hypothetical protein
VTAQHGHHLGRRPVEFETGMGMAIELADSILRLIGPRILRITCRTTKTDQLQLDIANEIAVR